MKIAALQYSSRDDIAVTTDRAATLIDAAAGEGAAFITLPECANFLSASRDSLMAKAEHEESALFLAMARDKARHHGCWLSLGSCLMRHETSAKVANRHYIIAPNGDITARYDKIHMFDANVGDGKQYRESDHFEAGTTPVVTEINGHKTGLSICYDLRFAGLFHHYAKAEAEMILTPAAFTKVTGAAHWHVLQRSRAIETGAFVIAAAQTGTHDDGRQTYGHALICDPWGRVLADAGPTGEMALATIDFAEVARARQALSAWSSQRFFD